MVKIGGIYVKQKVYIFCSYCWEDGAEKSAAHMKKNSLKKYTDNVHNKAPMS